MAKPIGKTSVFEGKDAIAVLKEMQETPTKEDKEFAKEIRNQRIVLFSRWFFVNSIFIYFLNLYKGWSIFEDFVLLSYPFYQWIFYHFYDI